MITIALTKDSRSPDQLSLYILWRPRKAALASLTMKVVRKASDPPFSEIYGATKRT